MADLDRGTLSDGPLGVDAREGFTLEELAHRLHNERHPRHSCTAKSEAGAREQRKSMSRVITDEHHVLCFFLIPVFACPPLSQGRVCKAQRPVPSPAARPPHSAPFSRMQLTADEDDFVELGGLEAGVAETSLAGHYSALDKVPCQRLELSTRQRALEAQWHGYIAGYVRWYEDAHVDVSLRTRGGRRVGGKERRRAGGRVGQPVPKRKASSLAFAAASHAQNTHTYNRCLAILHSPWIWYGEGGGEGRRRRREGAASGRGAPSVTW